MGYIGNYKGYSRSLVRELIKKWFKEYNRINGLRVLTNGHVELYYIKKLNCYVLVHMLDERDNYKEEYLVLNIDKNKDKLLNWADKFYYINNSDTPIADIQFIIPMSDIYDKELDKLYNLVYNFYGFGISSGRRYDYINGHLESAEGKKSAQLSDFDKYKRKRYYE